MRTTSREDPEGGEVTAGRDTNPYRAPLGSGGVPRPENYGPYRSLLPLARNLKLWLWFSAAGEAVGVTLEWVKLGAESGAANSLGVWVYLLPRLGPSFVCSILFLVYLYRSNVNCRALGSGPLSYTPAAMVWWHFVPIAHLYVPYRAVKEVFWASIKDSRDEIPAPLLSWWLCYAGSGVAAYLTVLFEPRSRSETWLGLLASVAFIVASLLAVRVVGALARVQEQSARTLGLVR